MTPQEIEKLFEGAPEDCIGALVAKKDNVHYPKVTFASSIERKGYGFSGTACEGYSISALEYSWDWVARPSQAWNGEGLPPVGLKCKIPEKMACNNPFLKQFEGIEVEIIAHSHSVTGSEVAVFRYQNEDGNSRYHALTYNEDSPNFEPIRTPEQIAADEREAAIIEMCRSITGSGFLSRIQAEILYDAGYRKQETK